MILNISSLLFFYKKVKILIFLTTTEKKITSWWTNIYWLDLCEVGKNNLPDQCENDGNEFYWVFLSKFVTRLIQMNNTSWREIYWTCIWINDQKKISLNVDFLLITFYFDVITIFYFCVDSKNTLKYTLSCQWAAGLILIRITPLAKLLWFFSFKLGSNSWSMTKCMLQVLRLRWIEAWTLYLVC